MDNKNDKKIQKFTNLYMSLGMMLGMSTGMLYGMLLFDSMALGMTTGMSMGMCLGLAIGSAKDKRLSENMMEITRIEDDETSSDKIIYVVDKDGNEKSYKVSARIAQNAKFAEGDRVAEETNKTLVSLENK
ncbi:MAG: hypothetical protein IKB01_04920 [Lachnospiraceae bacterium]|nr:hypothetical protein [Lachnospiraceae bacterium]